MPKPRISLCVIARDEEANIGRCLASARRFVDEIVVVDTGSRDGTVAVAERFGAKIGHFVWREDFAAARNAALELCTGDWVLSLDADEELDPATAPNLLKLVRAKGQGPRCYHLLVRSREDRRPDVPMSESYAARLFQRAPAVRWERPVHEQLAGELHRLFTREVVILHRGYLAAELERGKKLERNVTILRAWLAGHEGDAFGWFCLGKEFYSAGRFAEALPCFERCLSHERPAGNLAYITYAYALAVGCCVPLQEFEHGIALGRAGVRRYQYADLYYNLGSCFLHAGDVDRAITCYQAVIDAAKRHPVGTDGDVDAGGWRAHEFLGHAYREKGEYVRAVEEYLAAEACAPQRPEPRLRASAVLAGIGEMELARQFLQGVLARWPENEAAKNGLARLTEMEAQDGS